MTLETNEKVLAMYRAVYSLIEEGSDIYRLKVADITARAGIGKGTAYEYFRSKDELLIRALQYDFYLNCYKIEESLKKGKTFRENVDAVFGQIEECSADKRVVVQFLKLLDEIREKDGDCMKEHIAENKKVLTGLLDRLAESGRKEGCISSSISEKFVRMEIGLKFIGYYIFLQMENSEDSRKEMKDFLYETMIKNLSNSQA